MKLTRQHFQFIADRIKEVKEDVECYGNPTKKAGARTALDALAADFAVELRNTNPNFDTDRFLEACGV